MKNTPAYIVYYVKEMNAGSASEKQRGVWTKIGAAWANKA
jgi:hypothetical protein